MCVCVQCESVYVCVRQPNPWFLVPRNMRMAKTLMTRVDFISQRTNCCGVNEPCHLPNLTPPLHQRAAVQWSVAQLRVSTGSPPPRSKLVCTQWFRIAPHASCTIASSTIACCTRILAAVATAGMCAFRTNPRRIVSLNRQTYLHLYRW